MVDGGVGGRVSFSPWVMTEGYVRRRQRKRVPEPARSERHHCVSETVLEGEGSSGRESSVDSKTKQQHCTGYLPVISRGSPLLYKGKEGEAC